MDEHTMYLEETYTDGVELWSCPMCDYQFNLTWYPFNRTILNTGDDNVSHKGCKSVDGLWIGDTDLIVIQDDGLQNQIDEIFRDLD